MVKPKQIVGPLQRSVTDVRRILTAAVSRESATSKIKSLPEGFWHGLERHSVKSSSLSFFTPFPLCQISFGDIISNMLGYIRYPIPRAISGEITRVGWHSICLNICGQRSQCLGIPMRFWVFGLKFPRQYAWQCAGKRTRQCGTQL